MRNVFLMSLALALVSSSKLVGQDSTAVKRGESSDLEDRSSVPLRFMPQFAFGVGERLVFDVGYSFITAGEAVMSIPKTDTIFGRPCYQVTFTVNTTPTFSWIYKVEDRYESLLDVRGIFPWKFTQHVREGKYRRDFTATFDQANNVAHADDKEYPVPPYVHDVVSAFYYMRTLDFSSARIGEKTILYNFYKDSTYSLPVKFLGRQRLEVEAGTFDCIILEPLIKEGGLFKSEGRVIVWLTDDECKIPIKVSTKILIGSIDAELREYSGIIAPLKARVK
jgi:hypothetical protein